MSDRLTALHAPANEVKHEEILRHLQAGYEAVNLLLHRPFLQDILAQLTSTSTQNPTTIPPAIISRAETAVNISMKLISLVRTRQIVDWFSLKQVIIAVLLVLAASRVLEQTVLRPEKVADTMTGATEILARAANRSESAKRALHLLSEVWIDLKSQDPTST
jgi:hypothetical protein